MIHGRNKYGAKRTVEDGILFHSKREAMRYRELRFLERAGEIADLKRQVRYKFVVNDVKIGSYTSDFEYRDAKTGAWVVEDSKGYRPRDFPLRRNLMLACFGIKLLET